MKSCAFTGHRKFKEEELDINKLDEAIYERIEKGERRFLCGMAYGFDLIAAERVLEFKKSYKIELVACVPYAGQGSGLSFAARNKYRSILDKSDEVLVLANNYYDGCFLARDKYMVENSDSLICFMRRKEGGTFYTYSYAEKLGKEIILI